MESVRQHSSHRVRTARGHPALIVPVVARLWAYHRGHSALLLGPLRNACPLRGNLSEEQNPLQGTLVSIATMPIVICPWQEPKGILVHLFPPVRANFLPGFHIPLNENRDVSPNEIILNLSVNQNLNSHMLKLSSIG